MKEKCDNDCSTCPMQTQLHCVVIFSKATNSSLGVLADRLESLEKTVLEKSPIINPLKIEALEFVEESEKLPAPEVGENKIQI